MDTVEFYGVQHNLSASFLLSSGHVGSTTFYGFRSECVLDLHEVHGCGNLE